MMSRPVSRTWPASDRDEAGTGTGRFIRCLPSGSAVTGPPAGTVRGLLIVPVTAKGESCRAGNRLRDKDRQPSCADVAERERALYFLYIHWNDWNVLPSGDFSARALGSTPGRAGQPATCGVLQDDQVQLDPVGDKVELLGQFARNPWRGGVTIARGLGREAVFVFMLVFGLRVWAEDDSRLAR